VQNAHYVEALERGRAAAETIPDLLGAVMSIVQPIVECNRTQVDNGRTYLREMVFGDPAEPHHSEALSIFAQTEEAIAAGLGRDEPVGAGDAAMTADIITAIMFLSMATSTDAALSIEAIVQDIRTQISLLMPR
jgi:hypothetical protein